MQEDSGETIILSNSIKVIILNILGLGRQRMVYLGDSQSVIRVFAQIIYISKIWFDLP